MRWSWLEFLNPLPSLLVALQSFGWISRLSHWLAGYLGVVSDGDKPPHNVRCSAPSQSSIMVFAHGDMAGRRRTPLFFLQRHGHRSSFTHPHITTSLVLAWSIAVSLDGMARVLTLLTTGSSILDPLSRLHTPQPACSAPVNLEGPVHSVLFTSATLLTRYTCPFVTFLPYLQGGRLFHFVRGRIPVQSSTSRRC